MKKILLFLLVALLAAGTTFGATAYRYGDVVQTVRGDAISAATVTVYNANTTNLAALYTGVTDAYPTMTNPTRTDGYGRYSFYVVEGSYDVVVSGTNITTYTIEDIRVFGAAYDTPFFDVTDYGAVGDASTDNTDFIQLALDACVNAQGGVVFFPAGIYYVRDELTMTYADSSCTGVWIRGSGRSVSTITYIAPAADNLFTIDGWMNGGSRFFKVSDMSFGQSSGSGGAGGDCFNLKHVKHGHMDGISIYGFTGGAGVKYDCDDNKNMDLNKITDSYIGACQDGIWNDLSATTGAYNDAHIFSNNLIANNFRYDIHLSSSGGLNRANGHFISDSWIQCREDTTNGGVHGIFLEDGVETCKVASVSLDGDPGITCITISSGASYNLFNNVTVDGDIVDSSGTAEFTNSRISDFGGLFENRDELMFRSGATQLSGTGTPEGSVTAPYGSSYQQADSTGVAAMYLKESGSGNTGWETVVTGSSVLSQSWNMATDLNGGGGVAVSIGGHYVHAASDNDFNPSTTLGTANSVFAAHVYFVAAAGATDTQIEITGTSVSDAGGISAADADTVLINNASADTKYETEKKFVGQVTISKIAGTDRLLNYGWVKYWDNLNHDFTVVGGEALWKAGANDTSFDIIIRHHKATGWTYNNAAAATPPTPIFQLSDATTGMGTFHQLVSGEQGAWKRTGISQFINGDDSEGLIIEVITNVVNGVDSGTITMNYTSP